MTLTINNQGGRVEEVYFQDLIHPGLTIIHGSAQKRCSMAPGQTRKWTYTFTGERGNFIFPGLKTNYKRPLRLIPDHKTN